MTLKYTSIGLGISAGMYTQNIERGKTPQKNCMKRKKLNSNTVQYYAKILKGVYI